MYKINNNKKKNTLEISNSDKTVFGKICLNQGASLQELILKGTEIIQDLSPLPYKTTYASSILFPFANRIKDGKYSFDGNDYLLETNQQEEQNALHGFIFDKEFEVLSTEMKDDYAAIILSYAETNKNTGFPFTYKVQATYIFTQSSVSLSLNIKNTDNKTFPFTLGWHPYFISEDLSKSTLKFDCKQKLIIGDRNITTGVTDINDTVIFNIENKELDDCWTLNSDKIIFVTPSYNLSFSSDEEDNFMQAYTPPRKNTIAIEPTTGVSDSFNNKIGLKQLHPKQDYKITWNIEIDIN
ncbi:aldose 1-epimerase [Polaribacter aquimarinus]|uniref:Aldose 1-epimerase n=1 Tax=Polaribacter aquimarinus TaxID=2100726 RepID=A0A2U2JE65_9FLAO|nr:aldose 1-epimerase [Polaribacter aquimarinus]PWG06626.1 hypothetical protein DIS07_01960 [Polaribacter aquimarinus]